MNHVHFAKAALLSLAALTVACSGAEPADLGATEQQQQAKSAGYGFEFLPDRITDNGAPAQGGAAIPASVEGRLAPEIIRDVVRAGSAPMKACYVDALASERGLQGEIARGGFSIGCMDDDAGGGGIRLRLGIDPRV